MKSATDYTKPILFSGPMIRSIIAGTKSQTRRVLKPQPTVPDDHIGFCLWGDQLASADRRADKYQSGVVDEWTCPYGQKGWRLWVRETWRKYTFQTRRGAKYRKRYAYAADNELHGVNWRPSIFMPREASRITLEVTGVRVERLQLISEHDAIAEGVQPIYNPDYDPDDPGDDLELSHVAAFAHLWDKLNAKRGYSWDSNPWVWVISFKRIEEPRI